MAEHIAQFIRGIPTDLMNTAKGLHLERTIMPGDNKTEQPTAKKLSDAFNKGQFARSQEMQTLFVTGADFFHYFPFDP